MNVLIVGNGAREYSIALALKRSKQLHTLYFAPGNGATAALGETVSVTDYEGLAVFAKKHDIGLTIIGPEAPLSSGIADVFRRHALKVFGPSKKAARLESSKAFMKNILKKYAIPTAAYCETGSEAEAYSFIDALTGRVVVKADGLCAGKGVIICDTKEDAKDAVRDMLNGDSFGDAGRRVVVEEYLDGFELSVFALSDGERCVILPAAQDHKRLHDNDVGPNTGGMGAYAPTPLCTPELMKKIEDTIITPTIHAMKSEGSPFEGVLFAGIMVVNGEPYTLEFNVRFGDPECEVLMPLIVSDPLELFMACADKKLESLRVSLSPCVAVGVVGASKNYPLSSSPKEKISIDTDALVALGDKGHVSFAGVVEEDGVLYASGGRILVAVGIAETVEAAQKNAYDVLSCVQFEGMQFRRDIAYQAICR